MIHDSVLVQGEGSWCMAGKLLYQRIAQGITAPKALPPQHLPVVHCWQRVGEVTLCASRVAAVARQVYQKRNTHISHTLQLFPLPPCTIHLVQLALHPLDTILSRLPCPTPRRRNLHTVHLQQPPEERFRQPRVLLLQHLEFRYHGGLVGAIRVDLGYKRDNGGSERVNEGRDDIVDVVYQDGFGRRFGLFLFGDRWSGCWGRWWSFRLADEHEERAVLDPILLQC